MRDTAKRLARRKATDLARENSRGYVLGADQTIGLDGERFTKPETRRAAVEQLERLSGRTHDLWCAAAVVAPQGTSHEACVHFEMVMRPFSRAEAEAYVDEDSPLDCAGAYKIESGGIRLFRAMRGDDYTAIVGLPLTRVWELLERAGYFSDD